jgi:meso-butanediol dehydrogenase/(S,S)-butanediol dehydrogenase/diacetyl reductase
MRLEGKVAIVTGATKGIGRIIAATMAAEGAKIVALGRTVARGDALVAAIQDAGGEALFVPTDVGVEADVQVAVQSAVDHFGSLTTLVNNAAATDLIEKSDTRITDLELDAWEQMLRVTLTGPMMLCKYAIPHMVAAGGGSIVNISSGGSHQPQRGMTGYTTAKSGLNGLARTISVDYADQGIRANTIITGMIVPPQALPMFLADELLARKMRGSHLTRYGTREDIAHGVVYLASDESAFVTATELTIDGGSAIINHMPNKDEIFSGHS